MESSLKLPKFLVKFGKKLVKISVFNVLYFLYRQFNTKVLLNSINFMQQSSHFYKAQRKKILFKATLWSNHHFSGWDSYIRKIQYIFHKIINGRL